MDDRDLPERATQTHAGEACRGCSSWGTSEQSQVRRAPGVLKEEARLSSGRGRYKSLPQAAAFGVQPKSAWPERDMTHPCRYSGRPSSEVHPEALFGVGWGHLSYLTLHSYQRWLISQSL